MFEKMLRQSVLLYLDASEDGEESRTLDHALEFAQRRRAEFDQRRMEIVREINRGTKRSSGKLPV